VEIKLWDDMGSDSTQMDAIAPVDSRASVKVGEVEEGRPHLRLETGGKGVDLKLEFPMQTELAIGPHGHRMKPCRELQLSTRTPNFELEVSLLPLPSPRRPSTADHFSCDSTSSPSRSSLSDNRLERARVTAREQRLRG